MRFEVDGKELLQAVSNAKHFAGRRASGSTGTLSCVALKSSGSSLVIRSTDARVAFRQNLLVDRQRSADGSMLVDLERLAVALKGFSGTLRASVDKTFLVLEGGSQQARLRAHPGSLPFPGATAEGRSLRLPFELFRQASRRLLPVSGLAAPSLAADVLIFAIEGGRFTAWTYDSHRAARVTAPLDAPNGGFQLPKDAVARFLKLNASGDLEVSTSDTRAQLRRGTATANVPVTDAEPINGDVFFQNAFDSWLKIEDDEAAQHLNWQAKVGHIGALTTGDDSLKVDVQTANLEQASSAAAARVSSEGELAINVSYLDQFLSTEKPPVTIDRCPRGRMLRATSQGGDLTSEIIIAAVQR